jgi:hypothetical protein
LRVAVDPLFSTSDRRVFWEGAQVNANRLNYQYLVLHVIQRSRHHSVQRLKLSQAIEHFNFVRKVLEAGAVL